MLNICLLFVLSTSSSFLPGVENPMTDGISLSNSGATSSLPGSDNSGASFGSNSSPGFISDSNISGIEKKADPSMVLQDNNDVSSLIQDQDQTQPKDHGNYSPNSQVDSSVSDLMNQYNPESVTGDQNSLQENDQFNSMGQGKLDSPKEHFPIMSGIKDLDLSKNGQVDKKDDGQLSPLTDDKLDKKENDMYNSEDTKTEAPMDVQADLQTNSTSSNHLNPEINKKEDASSSTETKEKDLENDLYRLPQFEGSKDLDSDFNKSKSDILDKARSIRTDNPEFDGKLDEMINKFDTTDSKTKSKNSETPINSDLPKENPFNKEVDSPKPEEFDLIKEFQEMGSIKESKRKSHGGPIVNSQKGKSVKEERPFGYSRPNVPKNNYGSGRNSLKDDSSSAYSPKGDSSKGGYSPKTGLSKDGYSNYEGNRDDKGDNSKTKGNGSSASYDEKFKECRNYVSENPGLKSKSPDEQVLASTNCYRKIAGLSPLTLSPELSQQAHKYSPNLNDEVMKTKETAHNAGGTMKDRCVAAGYNGYCAENVTAVSEDVDEIMDSWMHSDGHRKNILLAEVTHMGAGHKGRFWTQLFGSKL